MRRRALCIALLCFMGSAKTAPSQVLYTLESPNPEPDGSFGSKVSDAGDVNADGHADLITGASGEDKAYVFSGDGGVPLYTLYYPGGYTALSFGFQVSGAGDLDADAHDDFLVSMLVVTGPWGDPLYKRGVLAYSGASGQNLQSWWSPAWFPPVWPSFGNSIDCAGDVNNDGNDDVIVSNEGYYAHVYSGSDGAQLYALTSPSPETGGAFSASVAGVPDLDGDGYDDLIVGARAEDGGCTDAGKAYVFRGADGGLLHTLVSAQPESGGWFGQSVSSAGDVDGDGCDDIIVGARLEDGGTVDAGRAYIFSGFDAALLYTLVSAFPESAGAFGGTVAEAGDVNGDGYADVVVGAYGEDGGAPDAGRAYIFSGNGGGLLYVLESSHPESAGYFGVSVSGGGDMNGDGRSEVIVGASREDGGAVDAGRVYVFNGIEVPIELSSFTAEAGLGVVTLRWTTQSEQDNYGFYLYRSTPNPTHYVRITQDIIPGASMSSEPHEYTYVDRSVEAGTTYFYKLADVDVTGAETMHGPVSVSVLPAEYALRHSAPNPFTTSTTLRVSLVAGGHVRLEMYNLTGERVRTLHDGMLPAGLYEMVWDGRDELGRDVPPGAYVCQVKVTSSSVSGLKRYEQSRMVVLTR